jgi:hypothetical protein
MGWLSDKLGWVPARERRGISVPLRGGYWEVDSAPDLASLLRALDGWLPEGCVFCFEVGEPSAEVEAFMRRHAVPERAHVEMGTIWPRPRVFHVPAERDVLPALVALAEQHDGAELATHLHVYRDNEVLLSAFDLLSQEMWLPLTTPEERVAALAARLGVAHRRA